MREDNGCECSDVSENLGTLSTVIESARVYTEEELRYFVDVIKDHLSKRLNKPIDYYIKKFSPSKHTPKYCVIPVTLCSTNSFTESSDDDCTPCEEDEEELTCSRYFDLKGVCKTRRERIVFRHFNDLLSNPLLHPHLISLNSEHVGTSDEIPKWGEFLEMVDKVLEEKNFRLSNLMSHRASIVPSEFSIDSINQHKQDIKCEDEVCALPPRKSSFENINRFNGIELFGLSKFCRNLMRWTNCITKRWCCINCTPHLVIHLPSMSYPCHLRCTAKIHFKSLQNIQIGRLGWLVNEMSQVLYVHPGKSNYETKCILQSFVKTARPDVSLSRLWIIENDDNCLCKDVEEEYRSGCETLFYTPNVYRRVRHLSAGRHGFIIPGVLSKMDVLIACELNTPIVGPGLKFQKRLLNKHYVMSVLAEANIRHPPFVAVRNFHDLCTKMSEMMIDLRLHRIKKWLLRINCGFCGNQSAVICLKPDECHIFQEDLSRYLAKILPERLKLNVQAYKDSKDFFVEMERHGAILTGYPPYEYRTVSLGCFIEHDTAEARMKTTADVIQTKSGKGCNWSDVGYVIPQTTVQDSILQDLVHQLSGPLLQEQYIGFFGIDIVLFRDDTGAMDYWVVDIDPYYTDLLSFDDWRRFCLNIPFSTSPELFTSQNNDGSADALANKDHRYVVCSGKLYTGGSISSETLIDLYKKNKLAYSYKAKSGCMICPINNEKTSFLLFSIYRSRDLALRYFIRGLKALKSVTDQAKKSDKYGMDSNITNLLISVKKSFGVVD